MVNRNRAARIQTNRIRLLSPSGPPAVWSSNYRRREKCPTRFPVIGWFSTLPPLPSFTLALTPPSFPASASVRKVTAFPLPTSFVPSAGMMRQSELRPLISSKGRKGGGSL